MEVDLNCALVDDFKAIDRENPEFKKKCGRISQEISSGKTTIVQVVEQLEVLLVAAAPDSRELGTWILTQVLEGLPPDYLDGKQLSFLCAFYADRLKDHHQVIPAVLCGILALTNFQEFPEGDCAKILAALFQNVACQQQQENDRKNIYRIFAIFLQKRTTELCTMGLDFVYGVLTAVDGERSPKNLVFLFDWFPGFLRTVNLKHLTEEMFEVLACYFPVDFKAPSQDPNAITRDRLAGALAPCLTAVPQFAEYCFPLALEKLDSSLEIAKLDSLHLLRIGCLSFDTASYVQHSTEIWSQIQKELFHNPRPAVEEACLATLTAVIAKISGDPSLHETLKDISDTVKRNLLPDAKLFEPSAKLLLFAARASPTASYLITREVGPILMNMYNIAATPSAKILVLKTLVEFFDSYVELHEAIEIDELNAVPVLCLKSAADDNNGLKLEAYRCLRKIARRLPLEVRMAIYDSLRHLLLIVQTTEVREAVLRGFHELAKNYTTEVKEKLIDGLEVSDCQSLSLYLDALCVIAPLDYFTDHVVTIFLDYLTKDLNHGQIVIKALRDMLHKHESNHKISVVLAERNVVITLIDWCILNQAFNIQDACLESIAFVLKSVIGNQSSDWQRHLVDRELAKIVNFSNHKHLVLLHGILCRLKRDVHIDYRILNDLSNVIDKETDIFVQNITAQLLANLLNKCSDDSVLNDFLRQFDREEINLTIHSWITKALVMRNHSAANIWTNKLIGKLKEDKRAAKSFGLIINDSFDALSTESHCIKTLFYQQKFFTVVCNELLESYTPEYNSYLLALGYMLEHVPKQAVLLQFKKILKLIILCLDQCEESDVLTVLLEIIDGFISNKEQCFQDHFSDFLTRFLRLSTFDKSMKVRLLALKCLQGCAFSVPVYKLLPHKLEVLTCLGKVVDDKKRIVRREAVEARSLWFLLDAPTD